MKEGRNENAMKLKCSKESCGREWDYQGSRLFTACCPDCKKLVKIDRTPEEIEEIIKLKELLKEEKEEEEDG